MTTPAHNLKGVHKRKRAASKTGRSAKLLEDAQMEALTRSQGRCEATELEHACIHRGEQYHHVLARSAGGKDVASNLLHVCNEGHRVIHDQPRLSRELGYIRSRYGRLT